MQKELVTVRILEGGKTCREVNPLGEEPKKHLSSWTSPRFKYTNKWIKWQEAESKLRTWEIEVELSKIHYKMWVGTRWEYILNPVKGGIENSIHKAQIINGKAVIV